MTLTTAQSKGPTAALITSTIGQYLDEIAARDPSHPALIMPHQNIRWTYGEFVAEVDKLATGLLALLVLNDPHELTQQTREDRNHNVPIRSESALAAEGRAGRGKIWHDWTVELKLGEIYLTAHWRVGACRSTPRAPIGTGA